ncbi:MAG: HlyD family efflux transporter periplasmic adaptor subunit [Deltaproteobacteria bacterium]|nr:HlyD family efflux transporter periplasmic adaptor subunit [Deltaproteobacteria bacterium]
MTRRWWSIIRWVSISGAMLVFLVLALRPQPVPVDTARVVAGKFEYSIEEDGKTRVRERFTVAAPLEGRLERIRLKAGDPVERDMTLAVIHPKDPVLLDARTERELRERLGAVQATKQQAQAAVERAQASLTQAKADYQRTKTLADGGITTPAHRERDELAVKLATKDLAAATFALDAATHEVEMARAAVSRLGRSKASPEQAQQWEIRSPVLGRVLRVIQENEGVVTVGTPLLELADPSDLEVIVDVLTTDAVQIQPGAQVWFDRWGGSVAVEGRVRVVEPSGFTKISALGVEEQRVNVVIDIVSAAEQWQHVGDGYRVDARIVVFSQEEAVKVPTGALFRDGDGWAVFVVVNGRARIRPIHTSKRNGLEALVEHGLTSGDQVIVYPSDVVRDGIGVVVRDSAGA